MHFIIALFVICILATYLWPLAVIAAIGWGVWYAFQPKVIGYKTVWPYTKLDGTPDYRYRPTQVPIYEDKKIIQKNEVSANSQLVIQYSPGRSLNDDIDNKKLADIPSCPSWAELYARRETDEKQTREILFQLKHTYLHVCKDGTPDLRYKDNPKLLVETTPYEARMKYYSDHLGYDAKIKVYNVKVQDIRMSNVERRLHLVEKVLVPTAKEVLRLGGENNGPHIRVGNEDALLTEATLEVEDYLNPVASKNGVG